MTMPALQPAPAVDPAQDLLPDESVQPVQEAMPPLPISVRFKGETGGEADTDPIDRTREEFARWLSGRVRTSMMERKGSGRDDLIVQSRNQYEMVTRAKTKPWPGSANLHTALTMSIVDTLHAHLMRTLFGVAPIFQGEALKPEERDAAEVMEKAMEYICRTIVKLPQVCDKLFFRMLIDGDAIGMPYWHLQKKKVRSWETITEELLAEIAAQPGGQKQARKLLPLLGTQQVIEREQVTWDAPKIECIDILDFGVYPSNAPSLDAALIQFRRHYMSRSDLWGAVRAGAMDADAVRDLAEQSASVPVQPNADSDRVQRQGIPKTSATVTEEDRPYEMFTCLVKYDVDGDGEDELLLCEVEPHREILTRAELYPYFHDRPFFVQFGIYPSAGEGLYHRSLCEILKMLQSEQNAIRNQRVDNGTLRNSATVVAKRGIKWNPEARPMRPGEVIFTDNPREDIVPLQLGSQDQSAYAEDAAVKQMAFDASGANDTVMGQTSGGDKTASEIERVMQGTNMKFDVLVSRTRDPLEEIGQQLAELYAQYGTALTFPYGAKMLPDGKQEIIFRTISRQDMQTRFGFRVRGTSALANPVLKAQKAEKIRLWSERSPFVQANPRLQYEIDKLFLKGLDEDDYERYLGTFDAFEEAMAKAPKPEPERNVSVRENPDEVTTLATMLKRGDITEAEYLNAATLAAQAAHIMAPPIPGAHVADTTDNAAGPPPSTG